MTVVRLVPMTEEQYVAYRATSDEAYAQSIAPSDLRRHGHGRAIMAAAEHELRGLGVVSVGLNVFGDNLGARALYEQMGFEAASIQMR